jgi:hypothetical protein
MLAQLVQWQGIAAGCRVNCERAIVRDLFSKGFLVNDLHAVGASKRADIELNEHNSLSFAPSANYTRLENKRVASDVRFTTGALVSYRVGLKFNPFPNSTSWKCIPLWQHIELQRRR